MSISTIRITDIRNSNCGYQQLWINVNWACHTSRQCCASCTGFQFRDESTSNWRVLSSRHCLARHLISSHLADEWRQRLHLVNTFGDRSFAVAASRVWNSLPANLRDEDKGHEFQTWSYKKLSYCWENVRRESMPRIAEMDVEMTT